MKETLTDLVSQQFAPLTRAETQAVANASGGTSESAFGAEQAPDAISGKAPSFSRWGEAHCIRAELIRFLCSNREVHQVIHPRGIHVKDAWIIGRFSRGLIQAERDDLDLDLDALNIPFVIYFKNCVLLGGVQMRDTRCRFFALNRCFIGEFRADRSRVDGPLSLAKSRVIRPVAIREATIDGSLLLPEIAIMYSKSLQYMSCLDEKMRSPERTPYSFDVFSTRVHNSLVISNAKIIGTTRLEMASVQSFDDTGFVYNEPPINRGFKFAIMYGDRPISEYISSWLKHAADHRYKQPFDELHKWLLFNGQQKEASKIAIARERALSVNQRGKRHFLSVVHGFLTGYGYRPQFIWVSIIFAWLIGVGNFAGAYHAGIIVEVDSAARPAWIDYIFFPIDIIIPIVSLGIEEKFQLWQPNLGDQENFKDQIFLFIVFIINATLKLFGWIVGITLISDVQRKVVK